MSRLRWPDSTNSVSEKPGTIQDVLFRQRIHRRGGQFWIRRDEADVHQLRISYRHNLDARHEVVREHTFQIGFIRRRRLDRHILAEKRKIGESRPNRPDRGNQARRLRSFAAQFRSARQLGTLNHPPGESAA